MKDNDIKKLKIINELLKHGNITRACKKAKAPRITFYSWLKADQKFNRSVQDARADFFE